MDDLLNQLYLYASAQQVDAYLLQEKAALSDNDFMLGAALHTIKAALTPEQWTALDNYVSARDMCEHLRGKAFFLSGLAQGLSLGRLTA